MLFEHLSRAAIHMDMNWILRLGFLEPAMERGHLETPQVANDVWRTSAEISYWWRFTTQIWVALLIGWSKLPSWNDQWEALPFSGLCYIICIEFLRSFLRRHFGGGGGGGVLGCLGKQAMALRNAASGMEMLTLQFSILYYKTISYRD